MKKITRLLAAGLVALFLMPAFLSLQVNADGGVAINSSNFPDSGFRAAVSSYDTDHNGVLSDAECNAVSNIHCENMGVRSLQGIQYFPNITGLWCLNNNISSMDLSHNTHLVGIWCSNNNFTSLDFTGLPELEWVYCFDNDLRSLNVSNNPNLAYLECNSNPNLGTLDVSHNTKLENLFCSSCGLTSLNVSNNPMLCELDCFKNNLTSLNLSACPKLKRLDIWDNPNLGNVNISNLSELEFYNCANTGATNLDMRYNPQLMLLICGYNPSLTSLNVTNNPRLADLRIDCDYNLSSLDITHNPQLYYLQAFGLHLTSLNISNNPHLVAAYTRGVKADESHLGKPIHSYTIEYGGSDEYFEDLTHSIIVDDECSVITSGGTANAPDVYINYNDAYAGSSQQFATRGEAIQILYEMAGSPAISGSSGFTDIAGSPYANAIRWGEANNICFGSPMICSNTFRPDDLISREDFALMAHRFATRMGFGSAFDYGRTDWFSDFSQIDYYGWGAFTWSIQWGVLTSGGNNCYPHGRMTRNDLIAGANRIFNLDEGASYSARVGGNGPGTATWNSSTSNPSSSASSSFGGASSGAPSGVEIPSSALSANGGEVGDFVDRLYLVVLQRQPDPTGKDHWLSLLNNSTTGADVARGFFFSQEFLSRQLTDEEFLEILYATFFGRTPDDTGRTYWLNKMRNGMTREAVISGFVNSVEWANLCVRYNIRSGATTN